MLDPDFNLKWDVIKGLPKKDVRVSLCSLSVFLVFLLTLLCLMKAIFSWSVQRFWLPINRPIPFFHPTQRCSNPLLPRRLSPTLVVPWQNLYHGHRIYSRVSRCR